MSSSLRTAASPPESANTKIPSRSRTTRVGEDTAAQASGLPVVAGVGSHPTRHPTREPGLEPERSSPMTHLTLMNVSEDGKRLLLISDKGVEFTLDIDDKLRAALRGDPTRFGQLEIKMDATLRPRDIQARIRAGETPESVAAAAQTTVEAIMPYAAPVLAERQHIAERAQRSS